MITPAQIDEWLREMQARPESAAAIVRLVAARLAELDESNATLKAENILLRSGKKVEAYESQIAALTYQLETLKRQFGGTPAQPAAPQAERILLISRPDGRALGLPLGPGALEEGDLGPRLPADFAPDDAPSLQMTGSQEELLFVFDSGRAQAIPADALPLAEGSLDWEQSLRVETRGKERLAFVLPVGRLPLYEFGAQASRRGFVRRMQTAALPGWIRSGNVGTGVLLPSDRTFSLRLAHADDLWVLVSREGALWSMAVGDLPYMPEEALRLSTTDRVLAAFPLSGQAELLAVTSNGKVIHRDPGWLEPARTFKSQGQSLLSAARLEAGVRIACAAAVQPGAWSVLLSSDGALHLQPVRSLLDRGLALPAGSNLDVTAFCTFEG